MLMGNRRRRKMQAGRRTASNFVRGQLGKGRGGRVVPTVKGKRKQADHVEDGDAILEYNSYPSIIDLLQMHLHFR